MNIVDAIIILVIMAGAVFGFKRGFTRQVLSFLGVFLVVVLAFWLKNPVSIFLYEHLPFFKFGGILKGVTVLNIALYELIALLVLVFILTFVLRILVFASSIFEKLLKFTIILGIPSKILGAVVGVIESFVWVFIALYVMSLPVFNVDIMKESKYKDPILKNTPILSSFADDTMSVIEEFSSIQEKYKSAPNANEFNKETLDLFLQYNVITIESVDKLIENDKLQIEGVEEVLNCYRSEPTGACKHAKGNES